MNTHTNMLKTYYSTIEVLNKLKFYKSSCFEIFNHISRKIQNRRERSFAGRNLIITTITVFLFLFYIAAPAQTKLGPYNLQLRTENPLRESVNLAIRPTPAALDFDNDGDVDVMIADFDGGNGFDLLRNDGTNTNAAFNYAMYWDNPFNFINFDDGATATFADLDQDGDLDMLLGILDGTFRYYKNNPEATYKYSLQNSAWDPVTKSGNPFYGVDLGDYASPVFIDMDNDGDEDVVVGTSYLPDNKSMHYFINDGEGNFSEGSLQGINPALEEVTPVFLDVDQDGDKDIITGAANGNIYYYKRTGDTSFEEQTGTDNPFNGINKGPYSSPSAADFDHDGDEDLIFGAQNIFRDIFYFENKGNSVFEEKVNFDSPFDGVDVGSAASPYFIDFDNDGDADLIIGTGGLLDDLIYLENVNGTYKLHTDTNPFAAVNMPEEFVPSFVDLDGDGDKDLVGGAENESASVVYFKNEEGVFVHQPFVTGPFKDIAIADAKTDFADIDNDGDFDLFIAEGVWDITDALYYIRFYKNTGTAQVPQFTEMTGAENPLSQVVEEFKVFPRFIDIDHDGDLDALIGEGGNVVEISDGNEFSYYENTGTVTNPVFSYKGDLIPQGNSPYEPAPAFVDYDNDGDLDAFIGTAAGTIALYRNNNPPPVISVDPQPLTVPLGSGPAFIDPQLTLTDADNDSLVYASVSINAFETGKETLSFTTTNGVSGSFNSTTGILAFTGKAPLVVYQSILRAVTYTYSADIPSGRQRPQNLASIAKTLSLQIKDADGTNTLSVDKSLTITSGTAPVFADHAVSIKANTSVSIPLTSLVSDDDNNADLNSITIIAQPGSGANTNIDGSSTLTVDYSTLSFTGTETISLQVCDTDNNCDQGIITITVTNTAPVIDDHTADLSFAASATIDLIPLITDEDNNLDITTLAITQQPASGAAASIDANAFLTVNYAGRNFTGSETLSISVCDKTGACVQNVITLNVINTPPVFTTQALTIPFGGAGSLDLATRFTDAESNIDFTTLQITQNPLSGATASVGSDNILSISYQDLNFSGSEDMSVSVCDLGGECIQGVITINIINAPPIIQPDPVSTPQGTIKTINLLQITSDPDGNLDPSTLSVTQPPLSGAMASIEHVSFTEANLILDYSGITFSGQDALTIRACDLAGVCTESMLSIEVNVISSEGSPVEVFNAVAPNSAGDNKFLRIANLPQPNKVSIFNRWGDTVIDIENYDHETPGKRFEGMDNSGKALTTGTYFYKIEYFDIAEVRQTLTGYLSLKQ